MNTSINGTLEGWTQSGPFVYGVIYGDSKGRFTDGEMIRTSAVLSIEGDVLLTRNSRYKLGKPCEVQVNAALPSGVNGGEE